MAINTAAAFFAILEKSHLLGPDALADARIAGQDVSDPAALARILVNREMLTRWQAGQLLAGRSSFLLGKYKLLELLERRGRRSVFLGQHIRMHRRVALTILSRRVGEDPDSVEQFLREARAVAALDHPNIVQAYSVDHDSHCYYLVMQYMDGGNLQELVEADGPLDCEQAADCIRQAADGLAHGHRRNIVHGDIRPSNLLINDQGVLKIVGMGVARLAGHDDQTDAQDDQGLGSVDYLAPERVLGEVDFDHRADIYSLGCTFYFLLTGRPPFSEGLLHERLMSHRTLQPQSIFERRPDASKDLVEICQRMMAKKPADRYQSAEEISRALAMRPPHEPQLKRAVALKTADPPEDAAEQGLPSIDVGLQRGSGATITLGEKQSRKTGYFAVRRRRYSAGIVAVLAVAAVLFAVVPSVVGPGRHTAENARIATELGVVGSAKEDSPRAYGKPSDAPEDDGDESWPALSTVDMSRPEMLLADAHQPDRPAPVAQAPGPDPGSNSQPVPEAESQPETKAEPDLGPAPDSQPPSQQAAETEPPSKPEETGDPFRELKLAVTLPALPGTDASQAGPSDSISLGSLHVPADASAKITLEGGKDAVKGSREFAIEPADGSSWLIHLNRQAHPSAESERADVARIQLDDGQLRFQWLKPADQGRADCLRNCGLWITVGDEGQWLPFAMPKEVKPLVVDFDDGRAAISLPAERWMPKASDLRLKITTLEGPFPKHAFQPADGVADHGRVEVSLSAAGLPEAKLDVLLVARGPQPRLEVVASYRLAEQPWLRMSLLGIENHKMQMVLEYTQLKSITDRLPTTDPRRAPVRERRELAKAWAEQLDALWKLCRELDDAGSIRFRVFALVGKHEVDLFATPPPGH